MSWYVDIFLTLPQNWSQVCRPGDQAKGGWKERVCQRLRSHRLRRPRTGDCSGLAFSRKSTLRLSRHDWIFVPQKVGWALKPGKISRHDFPWWISIVHFSLRPFFVEMAPRQLRETLRLLETWGRPNVRKLRNVLLQFDPPTKTLLKAMAHNG